MKKASNVRKITTKDLEKSVKGFNESVRIYEECMEIVNPSIDPNTRVGVSTTKIVNTFSPQSSVTNRLS
jgi:hypothetical protein